MAVLPPNLLWLLRGPVPSLSQFRFDVFPDVDMPNALFILVPAPVSFKIFGMHGRETMKKPQVISAVAQNASGGSVQTVSAALPCAIVVSSRKAAEIHAL